MRGKGVSTKIGTLKERQFLLFLRGREARVNPFFVFISACTNQNLKCHSSYLNTAYQSFLIETHNFSVFLLNNSFTFH